MKISGENSSIASRVHVVDDTRDYLRLLVQMEETERRFDEYWSHHMVKLKQCLELRCFEQDFRELQVKKFKSLQSLSSFIKYQLFVCPG